MRDVEVRLLQIEDVRHLVAQHADPVEFLPQPRVAGRDHRHQMARARRDRADERQARHPGAEPGVAVLTLRLIEDIDRRLLRRRVIELAAQLLKNFFHPLFGVSAQQRVAFLETHQTMGGFLAAPSSPARRADSACYARGRCTDRRRTPFSISAALRSRGPDACTAIPIDPPGRAAWALRESPRDNIFPPAAACSARPAIRRAYRKIRRRGDFPR